MIRKLSVSRQWKANIKNFLDQTFIIRLTESIKNILFYSPTHFRFDQRTPIFWLSSLKEFFPKNSAMLVSLPPRAKRESIKVLINVIPRAKRKSKGILINLPSRPRREAQLVLVNLPAKAKREASGVFKF